LDQPTYEHIVGAEAVRLGPGELVLLRKVDRLVAYDQPPVPPPGPRRLFLYIDGQQSRRFSRVATLMSVVQPLGIDLQRELVGQEYPFAFIMSIMLEVGRVIRAHPLYDHIGCEYGIDPARHEPHIEGSMLRFAVARSYFREEGRSYVAEVRLDLDTMMHDVRILAYRRRGRR